MKPTLPLNSQLTISIRPMYGVRTLMFSSPDSNLQARTRENAPGVDSADASEWLTTTPVPVCESNLVRWMSSAQPVVAVTNELFPRPQFQMNDLSIRTSPEVPVWLIPVQPVVPAVRPSISQSLRSRI